MLIGISLAKSATKSVRIKFYILTLISSVRSSLCNHALLKVCNNPLFNFYSEAKTNKQFNN